MGEYPNLSKNIRVQAPNHCQLYTLIDFTPACQMEWWQPWNQKASESLWLAQTILFVVASPRTCWQWSAWLRKTTCVMWRHLQQTSCQIEWRMDHMEIRKPWGPKPLNCMDRSTTPPLCEANRFPHEVDFQHCKTRVWMFLLCCFAKTCFENQP